MKKAILLSYTFPPLATGGTQSVINMCKFLPQAGWEVIPVTVKNPTGMDSDPTLLDSLPADQLVVRVPHGRSSRSSSGHSSRQSIPKGLKKLAAFIKNYYIMIPDRVITWQSSVLPVLIEAINEHKPHCIISRGPHHSLHLIARKAARASDLPFIPFFGDLWLADSNVDWPSRINRYIEGLLEKKVVHSARGIIATTEGSTGYFIGKYGDKAPPTFVAENAYDPERMGEPAPEKEKGEFLVAGWTGNFFSNQSPDELISGLALFFKRNPQSRVRLKMAGGIDQASLSKLSENLLKGKVTHVGRLSWNDVPEFQRSCDLLIGFLPDRPGSELKNCRKTGEYLISGRPILGIVPPQGDMAKRIVRYGNGYIAAPRAEEIAIAFEEIEYQWQISSLNIPYDIGAVKETFSAQNTIPKLAGFLNRMVAP